MLLTTTLAIAMVHFTSIYRLTFSPKTSGSQGSTPRDALFSESAAGADGQLKVNPTLAPLRSDRHFADVLWRVSLPQSVKLAAITRDKIQ